MGWGEDKVESVLSIVAGILHLGQVSFESKMSHGGHEIATSADQKTVADAAKLLGVDVDKLITALTVRVMITRGDAIHIDLTPELAHAARDALAKASNAGKANAGNTADNAANGFANKAENGSSNGGSIGYY